MGRSPTTRSGVRTDEAKYLPSRLLCRPSKRLEALNYQVVLHRKRAPSIPALSLPERVLKEAGRQHFHVRVQSEIPPPISANWASGSYRPLPPPLLLPRGNLPIGSHSNHTKSHHPMAPTYQPVASQYFRAQAYTQVLPMVLTMMHQAMLGTRRLCLEVQSGLPAWATSSNIAQATTYTLLVRCVEILSEKALSLSKTHKRVPTLRLAMPCEWL